MRAGVDIHIAGAGGSETHTLRERAVMVRNSAGAGGSGMKKTVPRRALLCGFLLRFHSENTQTWKPHMDLPEYCTLGTIYNVTK